MADKNPFGGLGLGQMGAERQYMSGFLSPEQKRNLKQGVLGMGFQAIGAEDFFNKWFADKKPEQQPVVPTNYQLTKDYSPNTNYQLSGVNVGIQPNKINQGMGMMPNMQAPQQSAPSIDDEVDQAWGNKKTSEFTPRNPSLDQLPQQFAQGPVMPPASYPQLPQTGGLSKILTSFLG